MAAGEVEDLFMDRDDEVDLRVEDGSFDASDVPGGVDMGGRDVVGLAHDAGELADVIVHGVDDIDAVVGKVELAG